ncbi:hypothetical protein GALL_377650 [mine drainage metagenome]|uniref:Uncharacterized protein n=1 Tax=mine drainage metagenome TaxID=410659 RepID=A0A1J5QX61_9ZZZZ
MTGLAAPSAVPTDAITDAVSIRWHLPLANSEFDRCPELRAQEAEALSALSPPEMRRNRARGVPRRTAGHWAALARLVEPLDATRAVLHHLDDVRHRRAGAHAAAVVL